VPPTAPPGPICEPDGDFLNHAALEAQDAARQFDLPFDI